MGINEKVAFIKGLYSGLNIDEKSDNGRVFAAILDCMEEMADEVNRLTYLTDELAEQLCELEECCDDDCDCDDCDDDCDCGGELFDGMLFEVVCPTCNEQITVDEATVNIGKINCPKCNELLEFDMDDCEDGCCCCGHDHE